MKAQRGTAIFGLVIAVVVVFATMTACSWRKTGPSGILLIVIEDFGFASATCSHEDTGERATGTEILCAEAVRFTHAYTPSTLAEPAFASILTARYPQDHNVRNNGNSFLSAKIETAAELALQKGFRTAYFGGGPSIFRNSGLNQGFEIFDDNIVPRLQSLYRPAADVVNLFFNWRKYEAGRAPFFGVLHFSDLQFLDATTTTDLGEARPHGYRSQLDEVDETLGGLFRRLKKENVWDNSNIIVAGLSGYADTPRAGELREVNLHSENTRVSLFIKPARKNREGSFHWAIDANVSLVDVGATLFDLFGEKPFQGSLVTTSLRSTFEKPEAIWPVDRLISIESDWANWKGVGRRRTALRKGPFLYLHDEKPQIFNTLTDTLETSPLPPTDLRYKEVIKPFSDFARDASLIPFEKIKPEIANKVELGEMLWQQETPPPEALERLKNLTISFPDDTQLQGWRALVALHMGKWTELRDAGSRNLQHIWSFVADVNRGVETTPPANTCLKYFVGKPSRELPSLRECPSQALIEIANWNDDSKKASIRQQALDRFVRLYGESSVENKIAEVNYSAGHAWDVPLEKPTGPNLVDLVLALPDQKRFQQAFVKRTSGENE
jgi:hypothetical protein